LPEKSQVYSICFLVSVCIFYLNSWPYWSFAMTSLLGVFTAFLWNALFVHCLSIHVHVTRELNGFSQNLAWKLCPNFYFLTSYNRDYQHDGSLSSEVGGWSSAMIPWHRIICNDSCMHIITWEWLDGFSRNLVWTLCPCRLLQTCTFYFLKLIPMWWMLKLKLVRWEDDDLLWWCHYPRPYVMMLSQIMQQLRNKSNKKFTVVFFLLLPSYEQCSSSISSVKSEILVNTPKMSHYVWIY
jgi:hypothetical protein